MSQRDHAGVLKRWDKGLEVDTDDLVLALQWKLENQRRELARIQLASAAIREAKAEHGVVLLFKTADERTQFLEACKEHSAIVRAVTL